MASASQVVQVKSAPTCSTAASDTQPAPARVESRVDLESPRIRAHAGEAKDRSHPGTAVRGRMRAAHEHGADVDLVLRLEVDLRRLQEIAVGEVEVLKLGRDH